MAPLELDRRPFDVHAVETYLDWIMVNTKSQCCKGDVSLIIAERNEDGKYGKSILNFSCTHTDNCEGILEGHVGNQEEKSSTDIHDSVHGELLVIEHETLNQGNRLK